MFCPWQQLASDLLACILTHELPHSCSCPFHTRPAVGMECRAGGRLPAGANPPQAQACYLLSERTTSREEMHSLQKGFATAVCSQPNRKVSPQLFWQKHEQRVWDFGITCWCQCRLCPRGAPLHCPCLLRPVAFLALYFSFFFPEILLFLLSSSFCTYSLHLPHFHVLAPSYLLLFSFLSWCLISILPVLLLLSLPSSLDLHALCYMDSIAKAMKAQERQPTTIFSILKSSVIKSLSQALWLSLIHGWISGSFQTTFGRFICYTQRCFCWSYTN